MKPVRNFISLIILSVAAIPLFALEWGENDIIKFKPEIGNPYALFLDYDNISVKGECISAADPTNSWVRSYDIFTGSEFLPYSAFLNIKNSSTDSYVTMIVRDSVSDEILVKKDFSQTGFLTLTNIFKKEIYLMIEFHGTNLQLFSFGLKRIPREIIRPEEFTIGPELCFYGITNLTININLRIPSVIDMIVYDEYGTIVHYVQKQQKLSQGYYEFFWMPEDDKNKNTLKSGSYFIYIRAKSIDGKTIELSKKFLFIKN
ncbi:MAG: hypothetical protein HPY53_05210 [Brevinematales bacterium]|nr:hypothetical protein [Brevinematales bacterium]